MQTLIKNTTSSLLPENKPEKPLSERLMSWMFIGETLNSFANSLENPARSRIDSKTDYPELNKD